jgi:hypothetical protein
MAFVPLSMKSAAITAARNLHTDWLLDPLEPARDARAALARMKPASLSLRRIDIAVP